MTRSWRAIGRSVSAGGLICALVVLPLPPAAKPPVTAPDPAERPAPPSRNLMGVTGLIDTPSALMQPDAELGLTSSFFGGISRNTLAFQALPGLELAVRYAIVDDFFAPGTEDDATLQDQSLDVKLRLVEEGRLYPGVAVGVQDALRTGISAGEYIVATKRFLGGDLEVSGGVGWGRFASLNGVNNPFGNIGDDFRTRADRPDGGQGSVNIGDYFQGADMGFFGGIAWRTPLDGLTVKAEYSNDDYARERQFSDLEQALPLNFGVEYRPTDWAEIGAYAMYGREFGLRLTLTGNPFRGVDDPTEAPLPVTPRAALPNPEADARLGAVETLLTESAPPVGFAETGLADLRIEKRGGVRWGVATLPGSADFACPADAALAIDAEYGVVDAVTFHHGDGRTLCTVALRPEGELAIREMARETVRHPTDWQGDAALMAAITAALRDELDGEGIRLLGLDLAPTRATALIENRRYLALPRAIGRTSRSLARHLPASVERLIVVPVEEGLPVVSVALERTLIEDRATDPDRVRAAWLGSEVTDAPPLSDFDLDASRSDYPRLSWSLDPSLPIAAFDPGEPIRADLALALGGTITLAPGLSATARVEKRLVGTLDELDRETDGSLARVRSDLPAYLDDGDPGIVQLTGDYLSTLAPAVYGRLSAGLLERMFAGVSGEVLWKPTAQSWGLGAELNLVRQRSFETRFGFRDFNQITGHVSAYWDTPLEGVTAQLDAGRYLAGDYGATVTVRRQFANGWEVGAFATFTDASESEFGDGSFDRGLYLAIPLNWGLPLESRSRIETTLRPRTFDGGQRLEVANRLYPIVEAADRARLRNGYASFWK